MKISVLSIIFTYKLGKTLFEIVSPLVPSSIVPADWK